MPETWAALDTAPQRGHRHDLFLSDSEADVPAVAVPFLRAALDAGDLAVIATSDRLARDLADELGPDDQLLVMAHSDVYRSRTPAALTAFRKLADEQAAEGHRVRVVGETQFGPTPRHWVEWERYEAIVNEALRGRSLWGLCVFDTSRLADEVVAAGLRTHPYLVDAQQRWPNPDYQQPADFLRALPVPDEPLERTEPLLAVDDVSDFIGLRHTVGRLLGSLGGSPDLVEDLHLAIDEMSSNAVRHGGPPVALRLWASPDRVVCRIKDSGPGMDDPFAGYGPAHGADLSRGGMGLWLARQLCDHVDVLDEGAGLTVRLATTLR